MNDLDMNYSWKIGTTYDKRCVQMKPDNNCVLEPADCSVQAKYICMKSVCPDGFHWYDMKTCVKIMESTASKSDAIASCKDVHPAASLISLKSAHDQMTFENYLRKASLETEVFVGAEKKNLDQWLWDDGNSIFVSGTII